ncbi:thiopeptide maturation pyridine synthase [Herbidospora yilanensis]|uniref:thiopeptide maturation pyridine synthase n=1 Tax=Herbidospora yilanensis TaxID=354426 RepID=UPI000780980C|nr:thiopeptide maturation pyridine synthase [Herbidospora yilanensis]
MNDVGWRAVQIRYYEQAKDDLILDCVRPLVERLDGLIGRPYIVRHWRRGPHLRLNLRATARDWDREILPVATETITGYLRDHPSTARLDERDHLAAHRLLAAREDETGPLQPWYPDNSLQTEPYDDRLHIFGGTALADLVDAAAAESTRLTFGTLDRIRRGELTLFEVAIDLMVAVAHVSVPPIARGYMSYRSHVAAATADFENRDAVTAAFEARYRANAPALRAAVVGVVESVDGGEPAAHVQDWIAFTRRQKELALPLLAAGKIDLDASDRRVDRRHPVDYFDVLLSTDRYRTEVLGSDWFRAHRLVVNMLYAHLARLGVTPLQRHLLCHLVASAVEEEYGVSPLEKARDYTVVPAPGSAAG